MEFNIKRFLAMIDQRLSRLESNIVRLEEKLDQSLAIQRNHLIRIKHGEDLSDDMILFGKPYNELSPAKAYEIYGNDHLDFLVLDVSTDPESKIESSLHIPYLELERRYMEIPSKTIPLLVISKSGLNSILACELLITKGYLNLNHVSGGHQYWPGHTAQRETQAS
ncbi:MAG: rhodanese-like domain-containing protein [Bacteriovoracaceae bacterium]|jgi:rhodanese-related sulfurtransferase|nr:rhodanese-like domain-containing protein [Bacteriovoracaceae bacterium]